jgi:uncharacterized membrane protein
MLEEAKLKLERQFKSMEILRDHGKLILGSSSIFISLFTIFKITSYQIKPDFLILYFTFIVAMAFLYCRLIYFSIEVALPYPLQHAIKPTWEEYASAFKDEKERTIFERLVHQYLLAIGNNEEKLKEKYKIARKLTWCMVALLIIIILIAIVAPFICI